MLPLFVISHQKTSSSSYPKWQNRLAYIVLALLKMCPFYQCIADHFEEFIQAYDERFEREYGFWRPVIAEVIEKFLDCGDLTHGFARVRCEHCGHKYLLAFSCKGRYFCPSCHMKRVLQFREKVFTMLIHEEKICEDLAVKIRQWPHSGFNILNEVEISADDEKGRQTLAQYIIKAPVSQEKMVYDKENGKVIYKSKHGTIVYDPLDWLAAIKSHIPNNLLNYL